MSPANTWLLHRFENLWAVAPQSGAKDKFHSPVYDITFNPIYVPQRVSKNLKKVKDRFRNQN